MTRTETRAKIVALRFQLNVIHKQIRDLQIEEIQISDEEQVYTETIIDELKISKGIKLPTGNKITIGTIKFTENFTDEDTGEVVPIEREIPVFRNGVWNNLYFY